MAVVLLGVLCTLLVTPVVAGERNHRIYEDVRFIASHKNVNYFRTKAGLSITVPLVLKRHCIPVRAHNWFVRCEDADIFWAEKWLWSRWEIHSSCNLVSFVTSIQRLPRLNPCVTLFSKTGNRQLVGKYSQAHKYTPVHWNLSIVFTYMWMGNKSNTQLQIKSTN